MTTVKTNSPNHAFQVALDDSNTPSIPVTKAQLRTFRAIIIDLTKIIPKLFANPSPQNIEDLIDTLNLLSKFICSLDAASSLKAQGLAIIKNLITILKIQLS